MLRFVLCCLLWVSVLVAQDLQVTLSSTNKLVACTPGTEGCVDLTTNGEGGLNDLRRLVVGPDDRLYVSSGSSNQILRLQPDGRFVEVFASAGAGGLSQPVGLIFGPDGHLYVASLGSNAVLRFDGSSGAFIDAFAQADSPIALTFGPDNNLYVLSQAQKSVQRFDGTTGAYMDDFLPAGTGGMEDPQWLGFAQDDFLYVTDAARNQVLRFDPQNRVLWDVFVNDGLAQPAGASFDNDGNLYVANPGSDQILVFATDGSLTESYSTPGGPSSVASPILYEPSTAATLLYPWVSNNTGFESIVVAHNYSPVPAQFTLTARRASGPAEVVERTVPPGGFLREAASELFPILADGAGYAVQLDASVPQISGVWVTNNLTAASGASPAQGVAVEIPAELSDASQRYGNRIAYGFLPTTQGLTSAPVVVNLGDSAADVTLQFFNEVGELLLEDSQSLQGLTPMRPFAAVVNQLAPEGSGDVYVIAISDNPITGVSFVFNDGGEPAIGNVTAVDDRFSPVNRKVQWLQDNAIAINSTDPNDEDFSDLAHLADALAGVRVLMLGEQTHGDGTTFLAKARLIKYLHQELGFDVLAFEGGLYDCRKAWQAYQAGTDAHTAFSQGGFPLWADSQQMEPLIQYLAEAQASENPLEMAGFDSQFSGDAAFTDFVADLEDFLNGMGASATTRPEWSSFRDQVQGITENRYVNEGAPDSATQTSYFTVLQETTAELETLVGPTPSEEQRFWVQVMHNLEAHTRRSWLFNYVDRSTNTVTIRNLRDEQMGENLVWLANNLYPDRKIIVWAATFHIARNMPQHFRRPDNGGVIYAPNQVTMGDFVYEALGNESYAMGFTAYEGTWGTIYTNVFDIALPESGDLEFIFNQAGYTNGFINLRTTTPGSDWLRQPVISRPLGHVRVAGDWTKMLDGIIYTQTMVPSTSIPAKTDGE